MSAGDVRERAARHAALGEPVRLGIVDELAISDRAPGELRRLLGIESNLLAHHLDVLAGVGMIVRNRSSGDGRRRYVHLVRGSLDGLTPGRAIRASSALFVCTRNSARSQLAAAMWRQVTSAPAASAGTHPTGAVHPGAVRAARRAGLDVSGATPRAMADVESLPDLVVTVCDEAHEELEPSADWLHWSIPDPVVEGSPAAFDHAVDELRHWIEAVSRT